MGGQGYPYWVPLLLPSLLQASISKQDPHFRPVSQRMSAPLSWPWFKTKAIQRSALIPCAQKTGSEGQEGTLKKAD